MEWAEKRQVRLEYIQPGKPQQNATSNATIVLFAANGWGNTYLKRLRRHRTKQHNGSGLTTTSDPMAIGGMTPAMKLKTAA